MTLRYAVAKARVILQRMSAQAAIGALILIASHFMSDPEERLLARDTGFAIVSISVTRWLSQQGKRRVNEQGAPVRHPTLRFRPPGER